MTLCPFLEGNASSRPCKGDKVHPQQRTTDTFTPSHSPSLLKGSSSALTGDASGTEGIVPAAPSSWERPLCLQAELVPGSGNPSTQSGTLLLVSSQVLPYRRVQPRKMLSAPSILAQQLYFPSSKQHWQSRQAPCIVSGKASPSPPDLANSSCASGYTRLRAPSSSTPQGTALCHVPSIPGTPQGGAPTGATPPSSGDPSGGTAKSTGQCFWSTQQQNALFPLT